ncbi:hypothetical protein N7E81_08340 [Reichenbachiella carrageenanivorans]|uniref:Uncharacterized protein n=1 Tax=Reichenbachiella carrageenanivorans TaxID=2979869 RepID=A0ABY6D7I1_9BACT|nr:hypothetical protein [Reichenbachiella carrageenanivorans]UXX81108.1 hypothetical protein N7E81_08340 [Reichenbachiella carrageenanivorans]
MKVLFVLKENHGNPYNLLLQQGLKDLRIECEHSIEHFFDSTKKYDIIHFQWPEAIFNWKEISNQDTLRVKQHIDRHKNDGAKIIYTRHNDKPHLLQSNYHSLYSLIWSESHTIIDLLEDRLLVKKHSKLVGVPHGRYPATITPREKSLELLNIPKPSFVILVFGSVRNMKEQELIQNIFYELKIPNKILIAPGWGKATRPSLFKEPIARLKTEIKSKIFSIQPNVLTAASFISEEDVKYYFSAANVVLLPRINTRNSGVLHLAFSHAKPVIGLNTGNIGVILKDSNNFLFDGTSKSSIKKVCMKVSDSFRNGSLEKLGLINLTYAEENWDWKSIAKQHLEIYSNAVNKNTLTQ